MNIRPATKDDVVAIVSMIADDKLGSQREDFKDPLPQTYYDAFSDIDSQSNLELLVAEDEGEVIGTFQMYFLRDMTYKGGIRAQIEAVRVRSDRTGEGLGEKMFLWAIERAKERGAHLFQLTTDKQRPDAKRFYEKLGFEATHEGMKIWFNR